MNPSGTAVRVACGRPVVYAPKPSVRYGPGEFPNGPGAGIAERVVYLAGEMEEINVSRY